MILNDKVFCSAPWVGLFVDPRGEINPCCASRVALGNIKKKPLMEIINGPVHKELKQFMLEGKEHPNCTYCYDAERRSGESTRKWFNRETPIPENIGVNDYQLQMIDIRWSNYCNLKCLYCNPSASSRLAEMFGIPEKLTMRQWQDEIMQMVKENIITIKHVYLLGGEPFLIKENLPLLQLITDQHISLITNLALDYTNNKIYAELMKKGNVHWSASLEQIGKKFEYVRAGGNWDQVVKNVKELNAHNKHFSFAMQYCIYSAVDLYEILTEFKKYGNVALNMLLGPAPLVVENHCEGVRNIAISELIKVEQDAEMMDWLGDINRQFITTIKETLQSTGQTKPITKEFIEYEIIMNSGEVKFKDLWPDVWQLIMEDANEKVVS